MSTTYIDMKNLGIERFVLHRIRAFCPESVALVQLQELCKPKSTLVYKDFWTHKLHERPIFDEHKWQPPQPGFAPMLTVGKTAASLATMANGGQFLLARLLRQGVGIVTEAQSTQDEADLVEPVPDSKKDEGNQTGPMTLLTHFEERMRIKRGSLVKSLDRDGKRQHMIEDTAYEVVEIVFETRSKLFALSNQTQTSAMINRLRKAVAYFLARSYDIKAGEQGAKRSLQRVAEEIHPEALFGLVSETDKSGLKLTNLSQTIRSFVSLGPRGAVLAYAKDFDHPRLRVSALNMIEILRGRHFNLIVARTLADDTIRTLSKLAHLNGVHNPSAEGSTDEIEGVLRQLMTANYLYGLVVSDPGAFLLDGSTLTHLTDVANRWFNLQSLREDMERKMTALYRLWQNFQDSKRIEILNQLTTHK